MNEENKIQISSKKLEKALQALATSFAHKELYMEYLFIVHDVMNNYEKLENAKNEAEFENIAVEITSQIDEGFDAGILQKNENEE